jgi:hypothetical protein
MIVTDQVLGFLFHASGGPMPEVGLIDVPADLVNAEPELAYFKPGLSHGSVLQPDCTERDNNISHPAEGSNPERFAFIAVLYGWVHASDNQFIYSNGIPHLVHSVDHGHFLPGGPNWTQSSIATASIPGLDPAIRASCPLEAAHVGAALDRLRSVSDELIGEAIGRVPSTWGLAITERIALARYLSSRRDEMLRGYSP